MPLGKNIGDNISELKESHPDWSTAHLRAAALHGARSAGNRSIKPPRGDPPKARVKSANVGRVEARQKPASEGGATVRIKGKTPSTGLKFPIPDKAHARNALARLNQAKPPLTPSQRASVVTRARAVLGKM